MKTFLQILFFFLFVSQITFAQGSWTKIGDMPEIRYAHTVVEINGKIYIVGGMSTESFNIPTTALIYDTNDSSWTQMPLLNNEAKWMHTSCVVDGKLYVIGGTAISGSTYASIHSIANVDMYDPNTGQWVSKRSMPEHRTNLACASIDGKIYVVGGMQVNSGVDNYAGFKKMEVYDISTNTWTQLTDMPTGRWGHRALAFDGKIYVFGGTADAAITVYASVEVYDPLTNTWTTKSSMPTKRYQLTVCVLDNSKFAINGWLNSGLGPIYDKVEVYYPERDEWITESPFPVARAVQASIVIDRKIYVYGGSRTNHPLMGTSAIYEFSPVTGVEEETIDNLPKEFLLTQNYPNPFNPSTKVSYSITKLGYVTLKVYDVLGTEVETFVNEEKPVGTYELNWNAANLPSGVYFYRLQAGDFVQTRKMILLK